MNLSQLQLALAGLRRRLPFVTAPRVFGLLALLLGLFGTFHYVNVLDRVYRVRHWLFWKVATIWGWQAVFAIACVGAGLFLLKRVFKLVELPGLERAVLAMATGVVVFTLAMYAAGALGWYGPIWAVLLPLSMMALGWRELRDAALDARRAFREPRAHHPLSWLITAAGVLCVGILYLQIFSPDAINYDATWFHLVVPQDYAREGRIVPFPGDYNRCVPHLAGIIHTWGFTLPGLNNPPLRWMMALHDEFHLFLWTLAAVAAATRWLTHDPKLRGAWAAFFLFPYIFVYDHNMGGAADHVLAFFGVPLLLAARHLWQTLSPSSALLFGVITGGALLTKYQAIYLVCPLAPLLLARWVAVAVARFRQRPVLLARDSAQVHRLALSAPLWAAVAALGVSAPHFLKNLIFYDNPVYPFMQDVFASTPTVSHAAFYVEYVFKDQNWVPTGTPFEKLEKAARLFRSFSFEPHYSFTDNYPGFGSLFTLLLPGVLLVPPRRRLLFAAAMASGGVLMWALTFNVDRNLQIILPVLVCVTAALIVRLWRLGWLARLGLLPLVGLQIAWGGDALFYSGHSRMVSSFALIRSGFEGRAEQRFDEYRRHYRALGDALPRDARVLLHNSHVSLGIDREVVLDWAGFQGLISYAEVRTPRELHDYYRSHGITHLVYGHDRRPSASRQQEVLWGAFVTRYARSLGRFGGLELLEMPSVPPPVETPYRVASFGVRGYADGLYPIDAMNTSEDLWPPQRRYAAPSQPSGDNPQQNLALLADVDAVIVSPSSPLDAKIRKHLRNRSTVLSFPGQFSLYLISR